MKSFLRRLENQKGKRFENAHRVLKNITTILIEKYNVKRISLIGSCLEKRLFHSHSDIDICVEGLSDNLYFQALGELFSPFRDLFRTVKPGI